MKSYKINIITAITALIIAISAFLIIYRDFSYIPKFKGVFVCSEGVIII